MPAAKVFDIDKYGKEFCKYYIFGIFLVVL